MQTFPLVYQPALETNWNETPGAIRRLSSFAPLQSGRYGSMGYNNVFSGALDSASPDVVSAFITNQTSGARRLLIFRATNIDEYDSSGTKTNRATSLTSTANWDAANFGNAVIAVSPENNSKVSTGGSFTDLGGSSPKAKCVAVNFGFVCMGNIDDGSAKPDYVAWSAYQNYTDWVPAIATEAGRYQLLEVSGPITALAPFREGFVVWKDNGFWMANYIGGFEVWDWTPMSNRIGCVSKHAWAELDGKLYWMHHSGVFEFDGQTLRNIGLPVWDLLQQYLGFIAFTNEDVVDETGTYTADGVSTVTVSADDLEGVVWFSMTAVVATAQRVQLLVGYNARTGKWGSGMITPTCAATGSAARLVRATSADIHAFKAGTSARVLTVWNNSQALADQGHTALYSVGYPVNLTHTAYIDTGRWGSDDQSTMQSKLVLKLASGSVDAPAFDTLEICTSPKLQTAFVTPASATPVTPVESRITASYNTNLDEIQFSASAKWKRLRAFFTSGQKLIVTSIGPGAGSRP